MTAVASFDVARPARRRSWVKPVVGLLIAGVVVVVGVLLFLPAT